jgi:hypothetical protein
MNLYEIVSLENYIEEIAAQNDGEIPEELFRELVEAQTKSLESIDKLCRYIRHLEQFVENAKEEKRRISELQTRAENRVESIKKYLTPYVENRGSFDAGTFHLSVIKSESIQLSDNFNDPEYYEQIISWKPDKKKIKEAIKSGKFVQGAYLLTKQNTQIK